MSDKVEWFKLGVCPEISFIEDDNDNEHIFRFKKVSGDYPLIGCLNEKGIDMMIIFYPASKKILNCQVPKDLIDRYETFNMKKMDTVYEVLFPISKDERRNAIKFGRVIAETYISSKETQDDGNPIEYTHTHDEGDKYPNIYYAGGNDWRNAKMFIIKGGSFQIKDWIVK